MKRHFIALYLLISINAVAFAQRSIAYTFYGQHARIILFTDSTFVLDGNFIFNPYCGLFHSMSGGLQGTYAINGKEISFNTLDYFPKYEVQYYDSFYTEITDSFTLIPYSERKERCVELPNTLKDKLPARAMIVNDAIYPYCERKMKCLGDKPLFNTSVSVYFPQQLTDEQLRWQLFFYLPLNAL